MSNTTIVRWALIVCTAAVGACTDAATDVGPASRVVVVAGNAQHGETGVELPMPIQLQVVDADDRPVSHIRIQLVVVGGSGSIRQDQLTTDDQGMVALFWTLGSSAAPQQLEARVDALSPVEVTATACLPSGCPGPVLDQVQLLPITTYDGSGQAVHPDVAVGTGLLAGFWLAATPYPDGNANFENPSIFQGADGTAWVMPSGLVNPVERPPQGGYLSDPDIVFDADSRELWMFYREVVNDQNVVLVTRSVDGTRWDNPTAVASAPSHQIVSPTVVRGAPGAPWVMWSVNSGPSGCSAQSTIVQRRTSADGLRWGAPATTDLAQPGQVIWHLDVEWIASRSEYWAVYNTYVAGTTCTTDALYLARSADGIHWTTFPSPIARRGIVAAFADIVYRSTFRVDPVGGTVTLWLSGATFASATGYTWRVATLTRRIADLLATAMAAPAALSAPPRRDLPPPERDVGPGR